MPPYHAHMQRLRDHRDAHALELPISVTDASDNWPHGHELLTHLSSELAVVSGSDGDKHFSRVAGGWYPLSSPGMTTIAVVELATRLPDPPTPRPARISMSLSASSARKDTDALALLSVSPDDVAAHQSITYSNGDKAVIVNFTIPEEKYQRIRTRTATTTRIIHALDQLDPDELPAVLWEIQNKFAVT